MSSVCKAAEMLISGALVCAVVLPTIPFGKYYEAHNLSLKDQLDP